LDLKKILVVFGTRPEAIKMIPIVKLLREQSTFGFRLCVTAQHREMLDQVLRLFDMEADYDLDIMKSHQDLYDITSRIVTGMKEVLSDYKPDLVLVHGDTTTTSMAALSAFYQKVPIGHVEAGLRTGNIYSPWPEEANRRMVAVLAHFHFAPTQKSKENLLKENIPEKNIVVTGNTVIDSLFLMLEQINSAPKIKERILQTINSMYPLAEDRRFLLVTGHRRENFGEGFIHICEAIRELAQKNPDIDIVYPVHLNPNVQEPVKKILEGVANVYLLKPLEYEVFVYFMDHAYVILTDSGGIQEEAPSLGKPVLVMRHETERPEALEAGTVKLVGTEKECIIETVQMLLDNEDFYFKMSRADNPYGDGKAAEKIIAFIEKHL
jgi:UDP-N-acetylglucosamine 2-epimerase (non-hydrolysing)